MTLSADRPREVSYPMYYVNRKMCRSLMTLGCESQKESLVSRLMGEYRKKTSPFFYFPYNFKTVKNFIIKFMVSYAAMLGTFCIIYFGLTAVTSRVDEVGIALFGCIMSIAALFSVNVLMQSRL